MKPKISKNTALRKQVFKRFDKAINIYGYLSLRSIIESGYYYPRNFIIEPIRKIEITEIIIINTKKLLPQQQAISTYRNQKLNIHKNNHLNNNPYDN